jgi:glycerol-3-phosphate dehydrogenase (NAD(P)+)
MNIAVIGAGSWGTTLALVLNENKNHVRCWTIEEETVRNIRESKENSRYLPGVRIPDTVVFSTDLRQTVKGAELIVSAVPSQVTRKVLPDVVNALNRPGQFWVSVSKGIENDTYLRVSEVIHQETGVPMEKIAALSGPSHAEEVSRKIPTVVVSASTSLKTAQKIQDIFMNSYFRVYASDDLVGVELGGALKNIIALAAGICDGAGYGDNTKAALITRGLVEINRLGVNLGARSDTFAGLSGMGDLIVTCMSRHSRNRYVGEQIGKGRTLKDILDEMVMVAEGIKTTLSAYEIAQSRSVEMPITEQVYLTLFKNKKPQDALFDLMTRASKTEDW